MEKIDQLVASLSKQASPVRPAAHPLRLGLRWLALAAAYLLVSLLISGVRADLLQQLQHPLFAAEVILLLVLMVSTAFSAAVLSFPDLHQKPRIAYAPAVVMTLFVLTMLLAWLHDNPPAPLPKHSIECTLSILMLSFLPSVAIFYAVGRFASTHQRASGSMAMLFAFSIGALWLRLYEATDSIIHLIEWHYLPMLVVGVAGLWLGRVLLKW
jgi:hypothetical protein